MSIPKKGIAVAFRNSKINSEISKDIWGGQESGQESGQEGGQVNSQIGDGPFLTQHEDWDIAHFNENKIFLIYIANAIINVLAIFVLGVNWLC